MKICVILLLVICLCGCSKPVHETIADEPAVSVSAAAKQIVVNLPQEAVVAVSDQENGVKVYECEGYTLSIQTLPAGDLDETLHTLTGYHRDQLQLVESVKGDEKRYDCVFTAAGEDSLQVGRVCILDDGNYHYCLSVFAPEETAGQLRQCWQDLYMSYYVTDETWDLSTGS